MSVCVCVFKFGGGVTGSKWEMEGYFRYIAGRLFGDRGLGVKLLADPSLVSPVHHNHCYGKDVSGG